MEKAKNSDNIDWIKEKNGYSVYIMWGFFSVQNTHETDRKNDNVF